MRLIVHLLLLAVLAIGIGFGISYYALTDGRMFATTTSGPWLSWPAAGSPEPDPYTLAYLSRRGALQLGASEGIEFVADADSDGQPLDLACVYRIEGELPVASFWTLVAEDVAGRNVAASEGSAFLDSDHIAREPNGSVTLRVSAELSAGNWLEVTGEGPFRLVLRLYDSALGETASSDTDVALPVIAREECA